MRKLLLPSISDTRDHDERPIGPVFLALVATLAFAPYFMWGHILLGAPSLFGKSLLLSVLTTVILAAFIYESPYIARRLGGAAVGVTLLTLVVVLWTRTLLYDETWKDVIEAREGLMFFIYISVFLPYMGSVRHRRILTRVVIVTCVVQAIFGIVHTYYFPYIVTGIDLDETGTLMYVLEPGQGAYRENGTVISANAYGGLLVLGMLLLGAQARVRSLRSAIVVVPSFGLLVWAIVLSGSRYALLFALGVVAYYVVKSTSRRWLPFLFMGFVAAVLSSALLDRVRTRFADEGSGGRALKTQLAIDLATTDVSSLVVGVPKERMGTAQTAEGLAFSDNSYAKLLVDYGVFGATVLICYACMLWGSLLKIRGWVAVCLVYLAGMFAVTNAIIWDWWLLYAGVTVLLLNRPGLAPAPSGTRWPRHREPVVAPAAAGTGQVAT